MGSPVTQEYCGLWPQQTVASIGGKIPYVLKEMVTKHFPVIVSVGPWRHQLIREGSNIISLTNRGGGVISEIGNWLIWAEDSQLVI